MSRGLSRSQREILAKIKEEGCLNIFDVADILVRMRNQNLSAEEKALLALGDALRRHRGASSIHNVSSIYRMMKSLEKRGHVATVLHIRPREWYYVEWRGDAPSINPKKGKAIRLLVERGQVLFRTKGKIWEITLPKDVQAGVQK